MLRRLLSCPLCASTVLSKPVIKAITPAKGEGEVAAPPPPPPPPPPPFPFCSTCDHVDDSNSNDKNKNTNTFASLTEFRHHLRSCHRVALGLPHRKKPSTVATTRQQQQQLLRRRRRPLWALQQTVAPNAGPVARRAIKAAAPVSPAALRAQENVTRLSYATSQASCDAAAVLAKMYASASVLEGSALVFVDLANVERVFELWDLADAGAALFLRRRAVLIVIWEPRAPAAAIFRSRFARNVMRAGRLHLIRCKRGREAGDVVMCDLIVRINFELSSSAVDQLRVHVVGNDLRHRRCLQDLLGKDAIVGHHAFEGDAHHWRSTLLNLTLRCLPCACGAVVPPNSKFPHAEICAYSQ